MIRKIAVPALAAVALLCAGSAFAQPGGGDGAMRQACSADFQKFCSGVQPGGGARRQCMREHASQLSDTCKAAFMAHQKALQNQPAEQGGAAGQ